MSDAIGLEKVMTFDEWIRQECFRAPPEYAVELAKSAWDYQQARIEALTLNIDALCMELLDKDKRIEALEKAAEGYCLRVIEQMNKALQESDDERV